MRAPNKPIANLPKILFVNFWDLVGFADYSECWLWKGSLSTEGRGVFHIYRNGKTLPYLASRIVYALIFGEPGKKEVCHTCDNHPCCNPLHLFLGTRKQNNDDCIRKGRFKTPDGPLISQLSKSERYQIVRLSANRTFTYKQLAIKFGVSFPMINKVIYEYRKKRGILRKTWK
jgi:hypothetical protein